MVHAKIASPIFSYKNKVIDALVKLFDFVTSKSAYSHGDLYYAHYGLDIFLYNSNYTIGSMAKLLQDLEELPKSSLQ